jgi:hypothetical protein
MTTPSKGDKKTGKLAVKKTGIKDLKVNGGKAGDVKGGGGRYNASNPKTPSDPGCVPCA